jgi:hypothetical protein
MENLELLSQKLDEFLPNALIIDGCPYLITEIEFSEADQFVDA